GKDRYTVLSKVCLKHLEKYWRSYKPGFWLFPGKNKTDKLSIRACQHAYYKAKDNAGIKKEAGIHTLRHSFATHCAPVKAAR
ncbi:MAG TPA: tyrosine-type recombinase/integrase, partial [Methanosarcina sp.]|nr:tyrosine-type recombinase/integrase [Methanosarcina sp.]